MEIEKFLEEVEGGKRSFENETFAFVAFDEMNVKDCAFMKCVFAGGRYLRMFSQKCVFKNCTFEGADLATLNTIILLECELYDCSFLNILLSPQSDWRQTSFTRCKFLGMKWNYQTIEDGTFNACRFRVSRLQHATFRRIEFRASHWEGCYFDGDRFVECTMGVESERSSLTNLVFEKTDLTSMGLGLNTDLGGGGWNVDEECSVPEHRVIIAAILLYAANNRTQKAVATWIGKDAEACWIVFGEWIYGTFGRDMHNWWVNALMPHFKEEVTYNAKKIEAIFATTNDNQGE